MGALSQSDGCRRPQNQGGKHKSDQDCSLWCGTVDLYEGINQSCIIIGHIYPIMGGCMSSSLVTSISVWHLVDCLRTIIYNSSPSAETVSQTSAATSSLLLLL